jgi:hypothetical protein
MFALAFVYEKYYYAHVATHTRCIELYYGTPIHNLTCTILLLLMWHRGDSMDDYRDTACRRNTSLANHHPPLLYNVNNDPQELYSLNPYQYSDILMRMQMVKSLA